MIKFARFLLIAGIPLLFFLLTGCDQKTIYTENKIIEDDVWKVGNKLVYEFNVPDTVNLYSFFLNVRHTTDYKYSNLYFFISTKMPDGQTGRDTLELILADKEGKWFGKGIGKTRDFQVLLKRAVRLPVSGKYRFIIEQAMREEELSGISDVGIQITKL
jgi:gliding motility-associated lipoprotein GldH